MQYCERSIKGFIPNPSLNGKFIVSGLRSGVSGLEIFNVFGERVYSTIQPSNHSTIDLSNQPPGIYFLRIGTSEGIISKKLVVVK
ncbi:MAG: T9SS type A sorting domain-containing protein [Bacteroidetes bacterium]|nr:T9SS type A sorting domain-containing protein [Bacteroidota bacterium]